MVVVMLDGGGGGGVRGCQTVMRKAGKERQRAERGMVVRGERNQSQHGVMGPFNNCRHTHTLSLSPARRGSRKQRLVGQRWHT